MRWTPSPTVRSLFFPLALALIGGMIAGTNFQSGTFLTGWDTLHPEFNFPLAFSRALEGVWRTDQGLGAVAIQSHMADLPRIILLWIGSFIFPTELLRYAGFFAALTVGPIGAYALTLYFIQHQERWRYAAAFIAGLLYLANFGTVQHFVVPLEMFAIHYALVPWLFTTAVRFLDHGEKRDMAMFALCTLFAVPQAHTATLFYAYIVLLILSLCIYLMAHLRQWRKWTIRAVVILMITLTINAYWMFPNIYAAITQGDNVRSSKINRLFTPEAFAKNQQFGTTQNLIQLKNFLFDWQLYNPQKQGFVDVLESWNDWVNQPVIIVFQFFLFPIAAFGLLTTLSRRHGTNHIILLPLFLIPGCMLLNGTWPMTLVFERLGTLSPILKESLRFPFTKFSILYMLAYSVLISLGIKNILAALRNRTMGTIVILSITLLSLYAFIPAFTGHLIQPAMRVSIPQSYFDMFAWFNTQSHNDRVAILPIHSFWGWTYYTWGYQGAGFLQFGIPQAILDRDYDRWNPSNEQYQREMAYAVYSQDAGRLMNVLKKYNVRWVLLDKTVVAPGNNENTTLTWLIPTLLTMSETVREAHTFGDTLTVYEILNTHANSPVSLYATLPSVGPKMQGAPEDVTYATTSGYITHTDNTTTEPWRGMFTREERLVGDVPKNLITYVSPTAVEQLQKIVPCAGIGQKLPGARTIDRDAITYTSTDVPLCDHLGLNDLSHNNAYEIAITSRNIEGFPLQLCVSNDLTQHCDIFVHLHTRNTFQTERFLIPPLKDHGIGYTLNFNNFTIPGRTSTNDIRDITINEVLYDTLMESTASASGVLLANTTHVTHSSPSITIVNLAIPKEKSVLTFNQTFDPGWIALRKIDNWPFFQPIGEHVLVNNWANGWRLAQQSNNRQLTVYLFFWPQLLQWIGFALLPIPFFLLLRKRTH